MIEWATSLALRFPRTSGCQRNYSSQEGLPWLLVERLSRDAGSNSGASPTSATHADRRERRRVPVSPGPAIRATPGTRELRRFADAVQASAVRCSPRREHFSRLISPGSRSGVARPPICAGSSRGASAVSSVVCITTAPTFVDFSSDRDQSIPGPLGLCRFKPRRQRGEFLHAADSTRSSLALPSIATQGIPARLTCAGSSRGASAVNPSVATKYVRVGGFLQHRHQGIPGTLHLCRLELRR